MVERNNSCPEKIQPFDELPKQIILYCLKETLEQLTILKYINGWSNSGKSEFVYRTIKERFGSGTNTPNNLLLEDENINWEDFKKDCAFIEEIIDKTFHEIVESGTYNQLIEVINIYHDTLRDESDLENNTKATENEYDLLQKQCSIEEMNFVSDINELTGDIGKLKDEIEDLNLQFDIKFNYIKAWQHSKSEMNKMRLANNEKQISGLINDRKHDFAAELRVHHEMVNLFDELQSDLMKQLEFWIEKYRKDLTVINIKIEALSCKKEIQRKVTENLQKLFQQRQQQIDDFKLYKIEQETIRKEKLRKEQAATQIEAWWRGVMVRKGFGKYRKKKDKKGKKVGKAATDKK